MTNTTTLVLEARGLRVPPYRDGGAELHPVDFEVHSGEVVALLGLDTGSLTLLIDSLLGLHRDAEGETRFFGLPTRDPRALARIGTVRRRIGFPMSLTVREVVELVQAHLGRAGTAGELLERFELADVAGRLTGDLSREDSRWLAITLAFAGNPHLLLLDHPMLGMDLSWRARLWEHLRDFAGQGGAVLIVTHLAEDIQSNAHRVFAFKDGRVLAQGTPSEVAFGSQFNRIWFRAERAPVSGPDGPEFVRRGDYWTVDRAEPEEITALLEREGIAWRDLHVDRGNLHSAMLYLAEAEDES